MEGEEEGRGGEGGGWKVGRRKGVMRKGRREEDWERGRDRKRE